MRSTSPLVMDRRFAALYTRGAGFTLVELLAVLAIIGLLLSLLLPAVQQAREAARRTQCRSHLHQFGLAIYNYHDAFQMFPAGNSPHYALSLHVKILPYIDQQALYDEFRRRFPYDQAVSGTEDQVIAFLSSHPVPLFSCPSDRHAPQTTNYVGNFGTGVQTNGYNGVFRNSPGVKTSEITDGLSQTAAISEWLLGNGDRFVLSRNIWNTPYDLLGPDQLEQFAHLCRETAISGAAAYRGKGGNWAEGQVSLTMYNHVLFPNDASCENHYSIQEGAYSASSLHGGSVHVLVADGSVRSVSAQLDLSVWRAFGSRDGSETVSLP